MTEEIKGAPGCFGSALTYKPDTPECETCIFVAACGPRSTAALAALREKYRIGEPKKKAVSKQGFVIPVKVAALLEKIKRLGLGDVGQAIRMGHNPFDVKTLPFMALATHLIINCGGVKRKQLEAALEKKLSWSPETAAAHALQAVQALVALGAVEENSNGVIVRRKVHG